MKQAAARFASAPFVRRILPALTADLGLLAVFFYVALGSSSSAGSPSAPLPLEGQPDPQPPAQVLGGPSLGSLKTDLTQGLARNPANVGVVLRGEDGGVLLDVDSDRRFVLASVGKLYILAAYLAMLEDAGSTPDGSDLALLDDMIRYSDNNAATTLWARIGREPGLDAFLAAKRLSSLDLVEDNAWGTINASAMEVSELLSRLVGGRLLGPASTEIARELMSDIYWEQAWGVTAGARAPDATVMLKNGWYPEVEGWRVNTAGVVQRRSDSYVLVILAYPVSSLEEGIGLLEGIARRINATMAE